MRSKAHWENDMWYAEINMPEDIMHVNNQDQPVRKNSPWIIFKTVLHALTVMYIPVNYQHPENENKNHVNI